MIIAFIVYFGTVKKHFNGVILSEARNLAKYSFKTLRFVQGEMVDFARSGFSL